MMRRSAISWTDFSGGDANFVIGCTPVSEGCWHCYAHGWAVRNGRDFAQVCIYPDKLARLSKWNAPQDGNRRGPHSKPMVFVCDLADLFHIRVPEGFAAQAFDMFLSRPDITWQVLTKRPERMRHVVAGWLAQHAMRQVPAHIWLGVTAENQKRAAERLPVLLSIPAAVRFVSVEPMLEAVALRPHDDFSDYGHGRAWLRSDGISWIVCGAESGPSCRPFNVGWAQNLHEQCQAAGTAFFFKQGSAARPGLNCLLDGQEVKQWPE